MNRHVNLPFTEEGKKLNMTNEMFEAYKIVYQKIPLNNDEVGDNTVNGYSFKSLYNPDIDYGDDCIIVPLQSVFSGSEVWDEGTVFCNVIGSSNDKGYDENNKKHSWHDLFKLKLGESNVDWSCQAETNKFYSSDDETIVYDDSELPEGAKKKYICNKPGDFRGSIVGGHVTKDDNISRKLDDGDKVYIIPICHNHNTVAAPDKNGKTHGNGTGFYMKTRQNTDVLVMTGYISEERICELNG